MELRYLVIATVPLPHVARWERWMRQEHIPAVLSTGCFERATLWRSVGADIDEVTFVVDYACPTPEAFRRYETEYAPALRREHAEQFGPIVRLQRYVLYAYYVFEPNNRPHHSEP
ncbi:MAG: DUF4286 family protein [Candidatus Kapabacteria bacterium]|nr:DUF4286 family protein [Candidatus Kapabacteria bacterium]MDW8011776.1 DUF4286 family protein [Bacteroidota bacterium]